MKINTILDGIGNTPTVLINKIFNGETKVWMKLERNNPAGSIKDRIALSMIEDAEERGLLKPGSLIVEPTSGNTGVGLAMVAAVKNYPLVLVMPDSMTVERRNLMAAYGADLVLTPRELGMNGAIQKAEEILAREDDAWMPSQFDNESNVEIHRKTTAQEIIADFPEGIDYLITGVGTGGHISGVAEVLKKVYPSLKVYAVEPEDSPVISGGTPGPHPLQGIGAGFIPKNLNTEILDGVIQVSKDEAFTQVKRLAQEEGILSGISTGASVAAVAKKMDEIPEGSIVVTFNYDTGERYLSVDNLF